MKRTSFTLRAVSVCLVLAMMMSIPLGVGASDIDESKILRTSYDNVADVVWGTPYEDAIAALPKSASVVMTTDAKPTATVLHEAGFTSSDWTLYDSSAITLSGASLAVNKASSKVKATTGGTYSDFVIEATLKGTDANLTNNFGIMFRTSEVSATNADSYKGYFVGIGHASSTDKNKMVIGYGNNDGKWHNLKHVKFDYQTGKDYKLKVLAYGNTIAFWLDGTLMYQMQNDLFSEGGVGLRTYRQLFECSEFVVRTASYEELDSLGLVATETLDVAITDWSCADYDGTVEGEYTFTGKLAGTNYPVTATVKVATPLSIEEEIYNLSSENVKITDGFFRDYIKQTICEIIPTAIANVEKGTGGMPNIINTAKKHRGESYSSFSGAFYVDSDVHKVLESMCFAMMIDPMGDADIIAGRKVIADKLEEWIPYFVDAQEESGYFDTYFTLGGYEKFADVNKHELYCMGHFMEAAIAHYQSTGGEDTRLFDVAIKCADYLAETFGTGDGQRKQIAGHQEIELALLKLARLSSDIGGNYTAKANKYADLATFFLEVRGDYTDRTVTNTGNGEYWQDHAKVSEQTVAKGHAVRAQYMYVAMAELASINDTYKEKYDTALKALYKDVTNTKQYVTGGVGQTRGNEGFSDSYRLENYSSYCETCAGIANMMWNRSMSKIYSGSGYADIIETDLYNTVLGCVNFDGNQFFYQNRLATYEGWGRNDWFGTACCPPNLTRTLLSLGGYIYNVGENAVYVNQYITNEADIPLDAASVKLAMSSNMPWSGDGSVTLTLDKSARFALYLRMPAWSDGATVKVNGTAVSATANADGYIVVDKTWSSGDVITFDFSMPVLFEQTSSNVSENIGYVSLRRGPIVYCAEGVDNDFTVNYANVDTEADTSLVWTDSLDGKADPYGVRDMYLIKASGYTTGLKERVPVQWTFIPFYARANRGLTGMTVYVEKLETDVPIVRYATPSASITWSADSPSNLNDGSSSKSYRWTSYQSGTVVMTPWVQYDFATDIRVSGSEIWWFADNSGVRLPSSFEIYYLDAATGEYKAVSHLGTCTCPNSTGFITYEHDEVVTRSIRIVINNTTHAAGIVEWNLMAEPVGNIIEKIDITDHGMPSASYYNGSDSPFYLNDGSSSKVKRWTSYSSTVKKDPWVMYTFEDKVRISACDIWWYKDSGGVQLADGLEIYYLNDAGNFVAVTHSDEYLCSNGDGFIRYSFEEVTTSAIKVIIKNSSYAAGIVEWRVIGEALDIGGDLDSDRAVTNSDVTLLVRQLAGWSASNATACDFNSDGKVNNRDAIAIAQKIAGWAE